MRTDGTLDYAQNRYYDPARGRFTTPDPAASGTIARPGSWNRYAYTEGDPINFNDPHGLYMRPALPGEDGGGGYCDPQYSWYDCYGGGYGGSFGGPVHYLPIGVGGDGGGSGAASPRTYFLVVSGDCYRVPSDGGSVTREISYRLEFTESGMPRPMGYSAVISEHLTGDIPITGKDSPSSSAPGWFIDQQSILLGKPVQQVTQTFSARIGGASVGLGVMGAFGGDWAELNIKKTAGYVSINGDIGGKLDANGKLIPGSYTQCK